METKGIKPVAPADIRKAGWETEWQKFFPSGETQHRGVQGPFTTPWFSTLQEVLDYIKGRMDK